MGEAYKMPEVRVGEIVIFFRDCNQNDPAPAIVQAVGETGLDLGLFVKETYECFPVPHVRHRTDPKLKLAEAQSAGYWDYGPTHYQLLRLEQKLAKFQGVVDDFMAATKTPVKV